MIFKAAATKGSSMQLEIASTFTDIPGVQNITPDPGEEAVWESGDITSDYDNLTAAQVGGGGSVSGSKLMDPLDPIDQFLHSVKNNGGVDPADDEPVNGKVNVGSTGVVWPFKGILTKYAPKAEKKTGWMVDFEFKLAERMVLNEDDPA